MEGRPVKAHMPESNDVITLRFTSEALSQLIALLNEQWIVNWRGARLVFAVEQNGAEWVLAVRESTPLDGALTTPERERQEALA